MKSTTSILVIKLLVIIAGCSGGMPSTTDIISVDVNTSYPEKELILQDFMDVEYIPLETTDEFITQGIVKAVGKDILLVKNRLNDGDIFVFDRNTGKGLRKINRFGQGNEEYTHVTEIILDEENNEIFVVDYSAKRILVYDLNGNFKRSFHFADDSYYSDTFNYDSENLICYKNSAVDRESKPSFHALISKRDGSVTREIQMPFKEVKSPVIISGEMTVMPAFFTAVPYQGNWVLMNTSADTIYTYLPNGNIQPFITRNPSIYSMETEIFLFPKVLTDRYYFLQTMKKELTEKMKIPITNLVYDKQENGIYQYSVFNDDFSNKKNVYWGSDPVNQEIAMWQSLDAFNLVEANENGQLKGGLKEIAADLDEESNPVIMLIKHKK